MLTLEIEFPAHRYHATAWGTHVNEGVIEWPPSPWRLLRALIASWHLKETHHADIDSTTLTNLIVNLSESLPVYQIPDSWPGHTRHYMPGKGDKTTKVFDAFLHVKDSAKSLKVRWNNEFTPEEIKVFQTLSSSWNYLGRAESLVSAKVINDDCFSIDSYPFEESGGMDESQGGKQIIRLLAPIPSSGFAEWKRETGSKLVPTDLLTSLQIDTADFKKQGWSQPPGSRWVRYWMPGELPKLPTHTSSGSPDKEITIARFAVVSNVAPGITQAISIGERIHQSLVKCSDGHPIFTGTDSESGAPLKGHPHAYIFPESNNERGKIDFLSIYSKTGFDDVCRKALESLRKTWGYGGHDLQLILLGLGKPADFGGTNCLAGQSAILAKSKVWQSLTPFVPTRHPKMTRAGIPKIDQENGLQIGSPEHDLLRLLNLEGFPKAAISNPATRCRVSGREIPCLQFQRQRKTGAGVSAGNQGYSFQIEFAEPVQGPIAVGYGCHFGLGLFVPVSD